MFFHSKRILSLTALLSLSSTGAFAYNETDLFNDIPEIASATRISQNVTEVPVSTTVISRELIQASGAIDIAELFTLVPGFQVFTPNANKYTVTYHGASGEFSKNLDIRINGRPVYIPLLSTVDWNSLGISLSDIDYIEVIRGSNVPSYGSNAFMGAINIITKTPINDVNVHLSTTIGSQGRRDQQASMSGKTDKVNYRLSLAHEKNTGIDGLDDGEEITHANIHLGFTPTLFDSFTLTAGITAGYIQSGDPREPLQQRDQESNFQHLQWNHVIDDKNEFTLQLYHNYLNIKTPEYLASELLGDDDLTEVNYYLALASANWNLLPLLYPNLAALIAANPAYPFPSTTVTDFYLPTNGENGLTHTYGAEYQHTYSPNDAVTLATGAGLRYDEAVSKALLDTADTIDEELYFLFSNAEWKLTPQLALNAGFMSEFSSITDPSHSIRLAANYQFDDALTFRASVSNAYRTPSLLEENGQRIYAFPEGVPYDYVVLANDNIEAEQLFSSEVGAIWKLPEYNGYIDLKLFREELSNGLEYWFFTGPIDYSALIKPTNQHAEELRNVNTRTTQGIEIQTTFKPTEQDLFHLGYSYAVTSGTRYRGWKDDESFSTSTPKNTLTALYNHQFTPDINTSITYNYVSNVQWLGTSRMSNYDTIDIKASKKFHVGENQNITASLLIKNLFDNTYFSYEKENIYDRRLYFTLSTDF